MTETQVLAALWTGAFLLVHLGVIARVILRPHRQPASRIAWIVVIIVLPVIGILTYILLGETSIGRRRVSRLCAVLAIMPDLTKAPGMDSPNLQPKIPETYAHLFRLGHSVNGFEPVGGNCATLLPDSNATIESMVADIDASQDHVHLIFYIWLPDNNGLKVVEALKRAATRRVACRVMADGLGSHIMIESIYEWCLTKEFELRGLRCVSQKIVVITYKIFSREEPLRFDMLIEGCVLVEVKAVEKILPIHKAQLLSYMKLLDIPIGLLINFHEMKLTDGVHRLILPGANR